MFDWIPVESYTLIQYHFLFVIALLIAFHAIIFDVHDEQSIDFFFTFGYIVSVAMLFYMGLRPVSYVFNDTLAYADGFRLMQAGVDVKIKKDYLFNYLMKFCSQFMSVQYFFLLVAFLYMLPYFLFSRKFFGKYWFFAMFMFMGSFSFWSSGTNGLRNGLATSFFLLGLFYYEKKYRMYFCFLIGYFMHASLMIPIAAFVISGLYKNPKIYIYIWLIAIPLSLLGGNFWSDFFASLGFEDRSEGYLTNNERNLEQLAKTGFRWDFLIYSASAVFAGTYFIFVKKITDKFYIHMYGIYCVANAFWILVITAAFSNRFAYLSWFLMPAIFAYPMFRYRIWQEQYKIFGATLFTYFMFTYYMFIIKYILI